MTLTDTGICDGCETNQPNVETCEHSFTLCETCRDESACRYCRTEGMTRTWRIA